MRYEITILGVVQGVGYRPFVAALAEQLHIKGSVCNSGGVVRIDAFGDAEAMDNFICRLRSYAPPAARVDRVQAERAEKEEPCPSDFRIVESEAENHADLPLLPPDLPVCEECLAEMKKPGRWQIPLSFYQLCKLRPPLQYYGGGPLRQGSYHHEEICHVPFLQKRVCTDGKPAPPCTDHILS